MNFIRKLDHIARKLHEVNFLPLSFLILLAYMFPYFYLVEDSYIHIHDNLDANVAWFHAITKFPFDKASGVFPNLMGGTPINLMPSNKNFIFIIFDLLPTYYAYITNELLIRIIGFIGMYLLLKKYITKNHSNLTLSSIPLLFSVLPIYPIYGISVMGVPLIIFSLLNIHNKEKIIFSILVLVLTPFYSSLFLSGMFLLGLTSIFFLVISFKEKKICWYFLGGFLLHFCFYVVSLWDIFLTFLSENSFVSHRSIWPVEPPPNFKDSIINTIKITLNGHYHSSLFKSTPTIISLFFLVLWFPLFRAKNNSEYFKRCMIFTALTSVIGLIVFISPYIRHLLSTTIPLIASLNIERFYFLLPAILLINLASILVTLKSTAFVTISLIILISQTYLISKAFLFGIPRQASNFQRIINPSFVDKKPTYKQFFAQEIFSKIKDVIKEDIKNYRVISIGLHPSIALYNGFYTLDGYLANYSLQYKNDFRKIISPELNKSELLKTYFDNWGNRCYLYSHEIGKNLLRRKDHVPTIHNLSIDLNAFYSLGGRYIFSASPISNYQELHLKLLTVEETSDSFWKVYVYKLSND